MKICFTASGSDMDSLIDPRFGRCQNLIFVDSETSKIIKKIANQNINTSRGAGIATAQLVLAEKCDVVITGNIGPNAHNVLKQAGIKIYYGAYNLKIQEALKKYKDGSLKESTDSTVPGHFGIGGRFGNAGRGRGAGRR